jgi:glyoxylase-like metal-dependent hydrolase (beta-lactamase superfamily II)
MPETSFPIHAIQTGSLVGNETFLRGSGWSALLHRRKQLVFPVFSFVLEHPEGLIAIDTGVNPRVRVPHAQRRFAPQPIALPEARLDLQMRKRGLRPEDVRTIVITHLDWDHAGGVEHFPSAEVLVHGREFRSASTLLGRARYQPRTWPSDFAPTLFELDSEPVGPFPRSREVTEAGDVRLVDLPGHTAGQVGVIARVDRVALFFAADHVLRQDWYLQDLHAGRMLGLGQFFPDLAVKSSRRIARFAAQTRTVLLPSHDPETPARLASRSVLSV